MLSDEVYRYLIENYSKILQTWLGSISYNFVKFYSIFYKMQDFVKFIKIPIEVAEVLVCMYLNVCISKGVESKLFNNFL